MRKLNKTIFLSMLVAVGLALSVIESTIPLPIAFPGAKLGLSNMVVLITIVVFGFNEGISVSILKSIVLVLVTGSVSSFIYSFSGAILSCIIMYLGYRFFSHFFSIIGVSILGALAHNFAQVSVAAIIMNNMKLYTYLPFLMLVSLFSGYFVGLSSSFIIKNLKIGFNTMFRGRIR